MESQKPRRVQAGKEEFLAKEVGFETVSESWNEYKLSNGVRVRVKNVVTRIFMAVDENGEPVLDENGDPRVIVTGNLITTISGVGE